MEKVKITNEQKKLIDVLKFSYNNNLESLLASHLKGFVKPLYGHLDFWDNGFECLNSITPAEMSLILFYDHYEVELTKEENLLDFYNHFLDKENNFDSGVRMGVETVLSMYNIEIEGINK